MTKIEWCDETINPIQDSIKGESGRGYHCTKISPGCLNCYAETINNRFGNHLPFDGRKAEFELINSEILKPIIWKKPRSIFVQSMGDLFHPDIPRSFQEDVFYMTGECNERHTFLFLTKRPDRMAEFLEWDLWTESTHPDIYLGLTVCNQQEADEKIPIFLQVPGKKFLSIEPMLGPISLRWIAAWNGMATKPRPSTTNHLDGLRLIDAVVLGAESGRVARFMDFQWARGIRNECQEAGVPFFLKHISKKEGRVLDGRTHDDLPWIV